MLTAGSLFTGFGGLDHAVTDAIRSMGGTVELRWVCDHEPGTRLVLAHHHPDIPNHGDVHDLPAKAEHVDILIGGYPCPGESAAGKRLGTDDPRWLWPQYRALIRQHRPVLTFGENVRGHLTKSFKWVVGDLLADGYHVVWTILAASQVGAPHERFRVFWVAWRAEYGAPSMRHDPAPFAVLHDGALMEEGLFGWDAIGGMPAAGAAYAGAAYAGAAYAGAAPAGSLLVTPTAQLSTNGGSQHPDKRKAGGHGVTLADQIEQGLPTVRASDANGTGVHGQGGLDLRTTIETLLPTTTASDADRTSESYPRGNPTLTGALLPTTQARVAAKRTSRGAADNSASAPSLEQCIEIADGLLPREFDTWDQAPASWQRELLPTPEASDSTGGRRSAEMGGTRPSGSKRSVTLATALDHTLLPTPRATDGEKGGPNQRGSSGDLTLPSAVQPDRWGPYAAAIARWEHVLGRTAPEPGTRQLSHHFTEWLMGAPEGWICDVPGMTRNLGIRLAGNGVVRQQGATAYRWLLHRAPVGDLLDLLESA